MVNPSAIPLRLETDDLQIAFDLLSGDTALRPGVELAGPGGSRVRFTNRMQRGASGAPRGRLEFDLLGAGPGSVEPVATWLYQTLYNRLPKIWIGRKEVDIEPDSLRQALYQATGP